MIKGKLAIWALALAALPGTALATPAFDEARDYVLADKVGNALLVVGVGAIGFNEQDELGFTLLHYAARSGSLDSVNHLLSAGADPAIKASDGSTPLTLAKSDAVRTALTAALAGRQSATDGTGAKSGRS